MKRNRISGFAGALICLLVVLPSTTKAQSDRSFIRKYLSVLPSGKVSNELSKYRMTAVYTNRDLYGNFTDKTKVTGEYTRGLPGDSVVWNNIFISVSKSFDEPFSVGSKKEYMENFKYIPSDKMLQEKEFKKFPMNPENVFARNLVWDMYTFEVFSWMYCDSLKLNQNYIIPNIKGEFNMADIGKYSHNKIVLCWKGVSVVNDEICAVLDFNAIDNLIELSMAQIKTKGTEQYWGTVHLSMKTKNIEYAIMYGGTIQEIEVTGMKEKFLIKTIRELEVNRIQ